jgi:hypothetical protein
MPTKDIRGIVKNRLGKLKGKPHDAESVAEGTGMLSQDGGAEVTGMLSQDGGVLRKALQINEVDDGIRKAFELSGYDPGNPYHWKELFQILAEEVLLAGQPGAPRRWNPERYEALLEDFATLRGLHPKESISRICIRLANDQPYSQRYGVLKPDTLRKQLHAAAAVIGHNFRAARVRYVGVEEAPKDRELVKPRAPRQKSGEAIGVRARRRKHGARLDPIIREILADITG